MSILKSLKIKTSHPPERSKKRGIHTVSLLYYNLNNYVYFDRASSFALIASYFDDNEGSFCLSL